LRRRIKLTRSDALALLRHGLPRWDGRTLIYLDPPYYERGRELYYDYYRQTDHENLAAFITANMNSQSWIVSYDNVEAIKTLYSGFRHIVYDVGYSARETRQGREAMFFSPGLVIPDLVGPVQQVGPIMEAA
jgi:DNA adenine methylase